MPGRTSEVGKFFVSFFFLLHFFFKKEKTLSSPSFIFFSSSSSSSPASLSPGTMQATATCTRTRATLSTPTRPRVSPRAVAAVSELGRKGRAQKKSEN